MDELLTQIRALLDQYLAEGGDTPVAAEVQALADAIDSAGGDPASTGDPAMGPGADMALPEGPPAEGEDNPMDTMKPATEPTSFRDASDQAMEEMTKRKRR